MISLRIPSLFITILLSSLSMYTVETATTTTTTTTTTSVTTSTSSSISLSESLAEQMHGRFLLSTQNRNRKLMTVDDPNKIIEGQYIIVFNPNTVPNVTQKVYDKYFLVDVNHQIVYTYDNIAIKGVTLRNVTTTQLQQFQNDTDIQYMAPDIGMIYDSTSTSSRNSILYNATYNLDRLDDKFLPLDGNYKRKNDGGNGVIVYVLDSGLRTSHVEFTTNGQQRATCGYDAVLGMESNIPCDDIAGHGTHVAGLIGGNSIGVASQVTIIMVKISTKEFNIGSGGVIKGIEYVLQEKQRQPNQPMIVNMSFGTEKYPFLDVMVEALLQMNITVIASAGNDARNACKLSPSGVKGVVSVGASDEYDTVPYWSNYGGCVDIYAPGTNIISSGKRDDTRYVIASGTSQSAPMVSGVAALYLQIQPTLLPSQVFRLLMIDSLKSKLTPGFDEYAPNSNYTNPIHKNRLLHTRIFTDTKIPRPNIACPYSGRKKLPLCYSEGWLLMK